MRHMVTIVRIFITLSGLTFVVGNFRRCKWSNEDCETNAECCSQDCYQAHEGTDPRCSRGGMNKPCYADYQCENGLACGENSKCCSPYWGVCSKTTQCCDPAHICRSEEGFIYRRCLYPSKAARVISLSKSTTLVSHLLIFIFLCVLKEIYL